MTDRPPRIGLDLYPMQTGWPEMRAAVLAADAAGYDSLWTWDHLYGTEDPAHTIFEGWTTVAAIGALTTRPTVGLLVGANTFRNPGLVAKMAVTVDHVSGGRCVLGLGSGWRPREHADHGIDFGSGYGERLDWLAESVAAIHALLRGAVVSSREGGHYAFRELTHRPLPVRGPGMLPMLIGGGGEQKTLRIVARYADIWHHRGSVEYLARKLDILRERCTEAGRDPASIELAFGPNIFIRTDRAAARHVADAAFAHNDEGWDGDETTVWLGPPETIAELWRPYFELGFTHLIAALAAPYDRETIERLVEARALVGG